MTLTDTQIRETVAAMTMSEDMKAVLLKQAITDKNPGARFVVHAAWKRGTHVPPYETRKALRDATLAVGRGQE